MNERSELRICLICFVVDFFDARYLIGLWTLCSLDDIEFDLISLFEAFVALALDGTVVNKDVSPALTAEKAVALCIIEPLYGAFILCQWNNSLIACLSDRVPGSESTSTVTTLIRL